MRLVFMGTPRFAVPTLTRLLSSRHQVIAVFTQPDRVAGRGGKLSVPAVKQVAREHGIQVYQPEKLKEETWPTHLNGTEADAIVVVAYGKILPSWLINWARRGAVNLHASLLPKYRGAAPINWAIANGETCTGVTTMKINENLDAGDIYLQEGIRIGPHGTASDVHDRLATLGADLMLKTLDLLERGELQPIPQNPELATYAPMLKKSDGQLNWEQSSINIYNRIRGFNPWPGTYTYIHGTLLRIWTACPLEMSNDQLPGTLSHRGTHGAVVTCRPGSLQLREVQLENRRRVAGIDFLHGIRLHENQSILLGR
jgi:methionyl-tRNA formyltransferase